MIGSQPAILVDALPWWVAMPLLQLALLAIGMALDETYVNRTTVLAGALALYVDSLVTGLWLPVSLYMHLGLVVGAYGLYAYVVDGYVGNWFRILAYFAYSPLAIFLVVVLPDLIFFVGLLVAGYANVQLLEYFKPAEPYYFGPNTNAEFEEILRQEADGLTGDAGSSAADSAPTSNDPSRAEHASAGATGAEASTGPATGTESPAGGGAAGAEAGQGTVPRSGTGGAPAGPSADGHPDAGTGTGRGPNERGILPEFMRRL